MTRDVLLTGSVPLDNATDVFEMVSQELDGLVARISDGDQKRWIRAAWDAFDRNDALEVVRHDKLGQRGAPLPIYGLKAGLTAADIGELGPYGYAETASESYAEFKRLRDEGVIPAGTRFQVTMPGPLTATFAIDLSPEQLIPLAVQATGDEVDRLTAKIPAEDLAIQFDIAIEVECEEYRRTPEAFDAPVHATLLWTEEQMIDAVAAVSDRVPAGAELGYHLCSMWHHFRSGPQDNRVLVELANKVRARLSRPISYVHIPSTPEHDEADFAPLRNLRLDPETKLYLGLIHESDGLDGALRRIAAAETAVSDFGVAHFCGLRGARGSTPPDDAALRRMFALHRDAAAHTPR